MFHSFIPVVAAVLFLLVNPVSAYAFANVDAGESVTKASNADAMSQEVKASFGCLILGSLATTTTAIIGPENLVQVLAGGVVTPANSAVLAVSVVGMVFSSFCSIGHFLTPATIYVVEQMEILFK